VLGEDYAMDKSKCQKVPISAIAVFLTCLMVFASFVGSLNVSYQPASKAVSENQKEVSSNVIAYNEFTSFDRHSTIVTDVEFSPDDSLVASACFDGVVRVWNTTNGNNTHMLRPFPYRNLYAVSFFPDGKTLAATGHPSYDLTPDWPASGGCIIALWNLTSGESIGDIVVSADLLLNDMEVSPDGKYIAACGLMNFGGSSFIGVWNSSDGRALFNITAHSGAVQSLAYSPDGSLIASASLDHTVRIWNATNGDPIHTLSGHSDSVQCVAFSQDGSSVSSGSLDKSVRIWNVTTAESLSNFTGHTYGVWSVAFSHDGELVAAGEGLSSGTLPPIVHDARIRVWNITDDTLQTSLEGHSNIISALDFSSDDSSLASGSYDWSVKLWGDSDPIAEPSDDWIVSAPEDQGLCPSVVAEGLNWIDTGTYLLESMVAVYNGVIVAERYGTSMIIEELPCYSSHKHNQYSQINLYSATKSVSSILFGIAIDQGFINGVNENVLDYFSEYTFANVDSDKESMTFEHILTMTSGLFWNEDDVPWGPTNTLYQMLDSDDYVQSVLDQPMVATPGTAWFYNSGGTQLLLSIIEKATGMSAMDFAFDNLFEPLGIEQDEVDWTTWDSNGEIAGWTGVSLSTRNMAKIGLLMLNKGLWNGERVVSEEWVVNSTRGYKSWNYGYQWWRRSDVNAFYASGYHDVKIMVFPDYDVAVASVAFPSNFHFAWYNIIQAIQPCPPTTTTTTTTSTTSTTTPSTTPVTSPSPLPIELIAIASGAVVIAVLAVIVLRKRE
jgi:WD40 repeat protein